MLIRVTLSFMNKTPELVLEPCLCQRHVGLYMMRIRDDHYPVSRLDTEQDSEFATGYGYPKTAFEREPDTDPETLLSIFRRFRLLEKVTHCTIIRLLSSEAYFQLSVP